METLNATCPFCGCLCDDVQVVVEDGKIIEVKNGCSISKTLFTHHHSEDLYPEVKGKKTDLEGAIKEATSILKEARFPLIFGLSMTNCEAQRKAVELAELIGGNIDSTSTFCHGPTTLAMQTVGEPTCTLGEVKNRADLVIFWGCNPVEAHPRHIARYSVTPKGMFTPDGRRGRKVVTVDVRMTPTAKVSDLFLQVQPHRDYEVFEALRALVQGKEIGADSVGGIPKNTLQDLANLMKECKFGIVFFGMGLTMTRGRQWNIEAAIALVRDLNQFTKFLIIPMRGHYNVTGADAVVTWQTGYPYALNFSRGYPQYSPGEFTTVDLLRRREVDAALILGSDPMASLPRQASSHLERIPFVVLDCRKSYSAKFATVFIPVGASGVHVPGTAYRMDGVPVTMKKVLDSPNPSDEEVLEEIIKRLKQ
ncbi:MAG: formylmethanofuran dehydrogenase subunit B [Caldiserica bacterium]|jgi:formylmethanofuran dehydrogenase subunit B|nr:formylmethanofuran dehydrogenase subunit B [Caldisericota bacterium]MDH7562013.1 formylmethanofuran dehydrogenase subunit B [Caldisericota bacterium]